MVYVGLSGFLQLLQDLLGSIFDAVLAPVLRDAFNIIVNMIGALLNDIFSNLFLQAWVVFLKLVNFMESIFNVFSGVSPVRVRDVSEDLTLLDYFFRQSTIQKAFLVITAIAVVLAFLSTIFAVIQSLADAPFENKSPISTVLGQAIKTAVTFMVIPVSCLFVLNVSSSAVSAINTTLNFGNANATVSDVLFITVAQPCAKNSSSVSRYSAGLKYEDVEAVKRDFDYKKFNYVQGYTSTVLVSIIFLVSILQFIQRIFVILVLYLTSPFFVAMMPLDGGKKFKAWRDMFVAHMLSAFGPILVMKIYLLVVPIIVGADIDYGVGSTVAAAIKLLFIIGGAYAVYRSRNLLISVLNPSAAGAIGESGFLAGMVTGALAKPFRAKPKGSGGAARQASGGAKQASGGAKQASGAYRGIGDCETSL